MDDSGVIDTSLGFSEPLAFETVGATPVEPEPFQELVTTPERFLEQQAQRPSPLAGTGVGTGPLDFAERLSRPFLQGLIDFDPLARMGGATFLATDRWLSFLGQRYAALSRTYSWVGRADLAYLGLEVEEDELAFLEAEQRRKAEEQRQKEKNQYVFWTLFGEEEEQARQRKAKRAAPRPAQQSQRSAREAARDDVVRARAEEQLRRQEAEQARRLERDREAEILRAERAEASRLADEQQRQARLSEIAAREEQLHQKQQQQEEQRQQELRRLISREQEQELVRERAAAVRQLARLTQLTREVPDRGLASWVNALATAARSTRTAPPEQQLIVEATARVQTAYQHVLAARQQEEQAAAGRSPEDRAQQQQRRALSRRLERISVQAQKLPDHSVSHWIEELAAQAADPATPVPDAKLIELAERRVQEASREMQLARQKLEEGRRAAKESRQAAQSGRRAAEDGRRAAEDGRRSAVESSAAGPPDAKLAQQEAIAEQDRQAALQQRLSRLQSLAREIPDSQTSRWVASLATRQLDEQTLTTVAAHLEAARRQVAEVRQEQARSAHTAAAPEAAQMSAPERVAAVRTLERLAQRSTELGDVRLGQWVRSLQALAADPRAPLPSSRVLEQALRQADRAAVAGQPQGAAPVSGMEQQAGRAAAHAVAEPRDLPVSERTGQAEFSAAIAQLTQAEVRAAEASQRETSQGQLPTADERRAVARSIERLIQLSRGLKDEQLSSWVNSLRELAADPQARLPRNEVIEEALERVQFALAAPASPQEGQQLEELRQLRDREEARRVIERLSRFSRGQADPGLRRWVGSLEALAADDRAPLPAAAELEAILRQQTQAASTEPTQSGARAESVRSEEARAHTLQVRERVAALHQIERLSELSQLVPDPALTRWVQSLRELTEDPAATMPRPQELAAAIEQLERVRLQRSLLGAAAEPTEFTAETAEATQMRAAAVQRLRQLGDQARQLRDPALARWLAATTLRVAAMHAEGQEESIVEHAARRLEEARQRARQDAERTLAAEPAEPMDDRSGLPSTEPSRPSRTERVTIAGPSSAALDAERSRLETLEPAARRSLLEASRGASSVPGARLDLGLLQRLYEGRIEPTELGLDPAILAEVAPSQIARQFAAIRLRGAAPAPTAALPLRQGAAHPVGLLALSGSFRLLTELGIAPRSGQALSGAGPARTRQLEERGITIPAPEQEATPAQRLAHVSGERVAAAEARLTELGITTPAERTATAQVLARRGLTLPRGRAEAVRLLAEQGLISLPAEPPADETYRGASQTAHQLQMLAELGITPPGGVAAALDLLTERGITLPRNTPEAVRVLTDLGLAPRTGLAGSLRLLAQLGIAPPAGVEGPTGQHSVRKAQLRTLFTEKELETLRSMGFLPSQLTSWDAQPSATAVPKGTIRQAATAAELPGVDLFSWRHLSSMGVQDWVGWKQQPISGISETAVADRQGEPGIWRSLRSLSAGGLGGVGSTPALASRASGALPPALAGMMPEGLPLPALDSPVSLQGPGTGNAGIGPAAVLSEMARAFHLNLTPNAVQQLLGSAPGTHWLASGAAGGPTAGGTAMLPEIARWFRWLPMQLGEQRGDTAGYLSWLDASIGGSRPGQPWSLPLGESALASVAYPRLPGSAAPDAKAPGAVPRQPSPEEVPSAAADGRKGLPGRRTAAAIQRELQASEASLGMVLSAHPEVLNELVQALLPEAPEVGATAPILTDLPALLEQPVHSLPAELQRTLSELLSSPGSRSSAFRRLLAQLPQGLSRAGHQAASFTSPGLDQRAPGTVGRSAAGFRPAVVREVSETLSRSIGSRAGQFLPTSLVANLMQQGSLPDLQERLAELESRLPVDLGAAELSQLARQVALPLAQQLESLLLQVTAGGTRELPAELKFLAGTPLLAALTAPGAGPDAQPGALAGRDDRFIGGLPSLGFMGYPSMPPLANALDRKLENSIFSLFPAGLAPMHYFDLLTQEGNRQLPGVLLRIFSDNPQVAAELLKKASSAGALAELMGYQSAEGRPSSTRRSAGAGAMMAPQRAEGALSGPGAGPAEQKQAEAARSDLTVPLPLSQIRVLLARLGLPTGLGETLTAQPTEKTKDFAERASRGLSELLLREQQRGDQGSLQRIRGAVATLGQLPGLETLLDQPALHRLFQAQRDEARFAGLTDVTSEGATRPGIGLFGKPTLPPGITLEDLLTTRADQLPDELRQELLARPEIAGLVVDLPLWSQLEARSSSYGDLVRSDRFLGGSEGPTSLASARFRTMPGVLVEAESGQPDEQDTAAQPPPAATTTAGQGMPLTPGAARPRGAAQTVIELEPALREALGGQELPQATLRRIRSMFPRGVPITLLRRIASRYPEGVPTEQALERLAMDVAAEQSSLTAPLGQAARVAEREALTTRLAASLGLGGPADLEMLRTAFAQLGQGILTVLQHLPLRWGSGGLTRELVNMAAGEESEGMRRVLDRMLGSSWQSQAATAAMLRESEREQGSQEREDRGVSVAGSGSRIFIEPKVPEEVRRAMEEAAQEQAEEAEEERQRAWNAWEAERAADDRRAELERQKQRKQQAQQRELEEQVQRATEAAARPDRTTLQQRKSNLRRSLELAEALFPKTPGLSQFANAPSEKLAFPGFLSDQGPVDLMLVAPMAEALEMQAAPLYSREQPKKLKETEGAEGAPDDSKYEASLLGDKKLGLLDQHLTPQKVDDMATRLMQEVQFELIEGSDIRGIQTIQR